MASALMPFMLLSSQTDAQQRQKYEMKEALTPQAACLSLYRQAFLAMC
jgi:hypothetical protein